MSYLARLAAQTGLIPAPFETRPDEGLEVIEEEILLTAPAPQPPATPSIQPFVPPDQAAPPKAPPPEIRTVIEEIEITAPPPASNEAVPPAVAAAEPEQVPRAETPATEPRDAAQPTPEQAREIQLRQVLEWVSHNDRPAGPETADDMHETAEPVIASQVEKTEPRRDAPAAPPAIEIREIENAPSEPAPRVAAAPAGPEPEPPGQQPAPPALPDTQVVEERIDISIGAIHLDVTPSPPATSPAPPIPVPPAVQPRPPAPSSSRLRRRFIRM